MLMAQQQTYALQDFAKFAKSFQDALDYPLSEFVVTVHIGKRMRTF
jgi:hypothetical protein